MVPYQQRQEKQFAFAAASVFSLEDLEFAVGKLRDGRVNVVGCLRGQAGGMAFNADRGVRLLDPNASLGLFGLAGREDYGEAWEAVRHLGVSSEYLVPVDGKRTNRSRVLLAEDAQRLILRLQQDIGEDHTLDSRRRLFQMVARSQALLWRSNDLELTREVLESARRFGVYTSLCPSAVQQRQLDELDVDALFVNLDEACEITGGSGRADEIFADLVSIAAARHLIVMTTGPGPVYAFDRVQGREIIVSPMKLPAHNGHLRSVGCGDVFAGVTTFLVGRAAEPVTGRAIRAALRLAQLTVAVHMTDDHAARRRCRWAYARLRKSFALPVATA